VSLFSAAISMQSVAVFCRQMAQTYDAGIPVLNGLILATDATPDRKLRNVVNRMHHSIMGGSTLTQAAEQERKYWPNLFVELVSAGEMGGRLKDVLYHLAQYYDKRLEVRRKVLGSLVYPAIQLTVVWLVVSLLAAISRMQQSTGGQFRVDVLLSKYVQLQVAGLTVLIIVLAAVAILSRLGMWQWIWGAVKTFVWPFSRMGRALAVARFSQALGLLLGSGIDAKRATARAARTADNPYVTASLMEAMPRLERGSTLTEALSPCPYLDPKVREMLYVGEQSGTLDTSLAKAAEQIELEAMAAARVAMRIGEVAVLLLVALVVGFVVIRFYMNLYGGILRELNV